MTASSDHEWRLENARDLAGLSWHRERWARPSPTWDHDHCEGCSTRFADFDWPEVLREGFTNDAPPWRRAGYHWVCDACFALLAPALGWTGPAPA